MSRAATCEGPVAASTEVVDRCPVCAGNEATRLFAARDKLYGLPGQFPVVECDDCGHKIGTLGELKRQVAEEVLRHARVVRPSP